MFLKMKVLVLCILPVLSSAQFDHRQDRVFLRVNKQVNQGIQPNQEFIESDSTKTQGFADERGTQYEIYPINSRNSFNNQRITTNNNPSFIQSRTHETSRPRNGDRRDQPNERSADDDGEDRDEEDISIEEDRRIIETNRRTNHGNDHVGSNTGTIRGSANIGTNQRNSNTGSSQGNSRIKPSLRTINDGTDQHNIVFVDPDHDAYTNKPNTHRNGNTKTTQDNEISEEDGSNSTTTTIMPSVDDRAAFTGDKCPEGRVRFNGICIETDGDR